MKTKQFIIVMLTIVIRTVVVGQSWGEGSLYLKNGSVVSGTFFLDQTFPEGMIFQKSSSDSTKLISWPAFKVEKLVYSDEIIRSIIHISEDRIRRIIYVEQAFQGKRFELLIAKQPQKAFAWGKFIVGGILWAQHAKKISYRYQIFLHDLSNGITTQIVNIGDANSPLELESIQKFPYKLSRLLNHLDVDVKSMKKTIHEQKIETNNLRGLVSIIQLAEEKHKQILNQRQD